MNDSSDKPRLPLAFNATIMLKALGHAPASHVRYYRAMVSLYETRSLAASARSTGIAADTLEKWCVAFMLHGLKAFRMLDQQLPTPPKAGQTKADQRPVEERHVPPAMPAFLSERSSAKVGSTTKEDNGSIRAANKWYTLADIDQMISRVKTAEHARRLSAIVMSYQGLTVAEIGRQLGARPDMVATWIVYFNEVSPHALGIIDRKFGSPRLEPSRRELPIGYAASDFVALAGITTNERRKRDLFMLASFYRGYGTPDVAFIHGVTLGIAERCYLKFKKSGLNGFVSPDICG
jgi:hypothetical protein